MHFKTGARLFPESILLKTRITVVLKIKSDTLRTLRLYATTSVALQYCYLTTAGLLSSYFLFHFCSSKEQKSQADAINVIKTSSPSVLNTGTWVMLKVAVRKTSENQLVQRRVKDAIQGHVLLKGCYSTLKLMKTCYTLSEMRPKSHGRSTVGCLQMSSDFSIIENSTSETSLSLRECRMKAFHPQENCETNMSELKYMEDNLRSQPHSPNYRFTVLSEWKSKSLFFNQKPVVLCRYQGRLI